MTKDDILDLSEYKGNFFLLFRAIFCLFAIVCLQLLGIVGNSLRLFGIVCLGLFGIVWGCLEFFVIVWDCLFGIVWDCLGIDGIDTSHRRAKRNFG